MSAPGKLVRSSRWKTGPGKGQRPLGSECCVIPSDSGREAYTAIAWGVGLSLERSDIAGAETGTYVPVWRFRRAKTVRILLLMSGPASAGPFSFSLSANVPY